MAEPLTDEHLQGINKSLDSIKIAEQVIKRSRQAGIDVEEKATEIQSLKEKLLGIKSAFFPQS